MHDVDDKDLHLAQKLVAETQVADAGQVEIRLVTRYAPMFMCRTCDDQFYLVEAGRWACAHCSYSFNLQGALDLIDHYQGVLEGLSQGLLSMDSGEKPEQPETPLETTAPAEQTGPTGAPKKRKGFLSFLGRKTEDNR